MKNKLLKNNGSDTKIIYSIPISHNDLKRNGRKMTIKKSDCSIVLNGREINTVKSILKNYTGKQVFRCNKNMSISYVDYKSTSDLKRWGKKMIIFKPNFSIELKGKDINSIKSILVKSGEIERG